MQCPNCGTDNLDTLRFCVSCHTTLPAMHPSARRHKGYVYARHEGGSNSGRPDAALFNADRHRRARLLTGSSSARTTSTGTPNQQGAAGDETTARWGARADRAPADPPSGQRIEPRIDDSFPQGPSSAYERLHGLGPEFGESGYQAPVRSRLRRVFMMASVFVVGAGVGLTAAWWLHKPSTTEPVSTIPSSAVRSAPSAPVSEVKRPAAIRGISPSELPYDGAPPPAAAGQPSVEPVASRTPALPETSSGTSVANEGGDRNAGPGESEPEAVTPAAPSSTEQKTPQASQAVDDTKTTNAVKPGKQGSASVASVAPKRKSVARSDREIERIRRQVDEELKKKTEQGRAMSPASGQGAHNEQGKRRDEANSGAVARVSATRASLARCDKNTNFIRREFCRWQVCNGSWGKNGCPSYQQQASTY